MKHRIENVKKKDPSAAFLQRRSLLIAATSLCVAALAPTIGSSTALRTSASKSPHPGSISMKQKIDFTRDGIKLVGDLFLPRGFSGTGRFDAVIVQGSFTSVKEQMSGTYAKKLAEAGFVALAFDYAHYGESGGMPRQLEAPAEKVSDLKAAISYLLDRPFVKNVAVVGVCTSASNVIEMAATEDRVKAIATVAGFLPDPELLDNLYGADVVAQRKAASNKAREKYGKRGAVDAVPAYSEVDPAAINFGREGNYDYYLMESRANVPQYRNEAALMGMTAFLEMDPIRTAASVSTPAIVVHSDGCAFPEQAKKLFAALGGAKELAWEDGTHYQYYDAEPQVDKAVERVSRFLRTQLNT